jgi:hypothetical protein
MVFDSLVDALWIENMNTLLDDNVSLVVLLHKCVVVYHPLPMSAPFSPPSKRIKLKEELRMVFEVENLE